MVDTTHKHGDLMVYGIVLTTVYFKDQNELLLQTMDDICGHFSWSDGFLALLTSAVWKEPTRWLIPLTKKFRSPIVSGSILLIHYLSLLKPGIEAT